MKLWFHVFCLTFLEMSLTTDRMFCRSAVEAWSHQHSSVDFTWVRMWTMRWHGRLNWCPQTAHLCGLTPVWDLMCSTRLAGSINSLLHSAHFSGRSPVCVRMCTMRCHGRWNVFSHIGQACGFTPECVATCATSTSERANLRPHWSQQYGRSPVCVRMCVARLLSDPNIRLQCLHGCCFVAPGFRCRLRPRLFRQTWSVRPVSSVYSWLQLRHRKTSPLLCSALMCSSSSPGCMKHPLQMLHVYGFVSLPWVCTCATSRCIRLNDFPHSLQLSSESKRLPRGTASSWVRRWIASPLGRLNVRPQCWHCNSEPATSPWRFFSTLRLSLGCMYTFTTEFSSSPASSTSVGSYRYSTTSSFFILSDCCLNRDHLHS